MPKEIPIFLEPTIFKLICNNKIQISFYEEFPDIFFLGFPAYGITFKIQAKQLSELSNTLKEIGERIWAEDIQPEQ